ncbi:MAG TPA: hypothetical protein EYQ42_11310 [Thiotrichaceae bacterium]|jgi:hypothetical protein|nr:hypothetical protein [Thiotrichaceae bacterium]
MTRSLPHSAVITIGVVGLNFFGGFAIADTLPEEMMSKEAFLEITETVMHDACDSPDSPFHCMSKDLHLCRVALDTATENCMEVLRGFLPNEIDLNTREASKSGFGNCIDSQFHQEMGAENIDISRCNNGEN